MRAIAEGLFTGEERPRLVGGRHRATGRIVFPCPEGCDHEPHPLRRDGTLWSWTVQRYRPKTPPYAGPEAFVPWVLGYVELAGETIVESRIEGVAFDAVRIGMPLVLDFVPLDPGDAQSPMIHCFRPVAGRA